MHPSMSATRERDKLGHQKGLLYKGPFIRQTTYLIRGTRNLKCNVSQTNWWEGGRTEDSNKNKNFFMACRNNSHYSQRRLRAAARRGVRSGGPSTAPPAGKEKEVRRDAGRHSLYQRRDWREGEGCKRVDLRRKRTTEEEERRERSQTRSPNAIPVTD